MDHTPLSFPLKAKLFLHNALVRYYRKSPRFGWVFLFKKWAAYGGLFALWMGFVLIFNPPSALAWIGGAAFFFLNHYLWLQPSYEFYSLLDELRESKDGIERTQLDDNDIWFTHHFIGRLPGELIIWSYVSQKEKQASFQKHLQSQIKSVSPLSKKENNDRF